MIVHVDTSLLVDALTGPKRSANALRQAGASGHILTMSSLVLYEWLRGPRLAEQLAAADALFPPHTLVPFGRDEAARAATLYRAARRARSREGDIAIAACAIEHGAALWTLNRADFDDIPGLLLYAVS
jgi:predicted nucleic acid-binding protein